MWMKDDNVPPPTKEYDWHNFLLFEFLFPDNKSNNNNKRIINNERLRTGGDCYPKCPQRLL